MNYNKGIQKPILKVLTKVFGLGNNLAKDYFNKIGVNLKNNPKMLQKKKNRELDVILSKNLTDKKLKTELKEIDLFSKKIKNYKGIRNKLKYPARGQRTHTNAKTKKKL